MTWTVAGAGHKNVGLVGGVIHGDDAEAFHRRLQRADRVDLGDPDLGRQCAHGLRRTLAHVAVAADQRDLAGDHYIGGAFDAVHQRFAAAVQIVELGLGDGVVDVDRREFQFAALVHLVQAVHAGGGFLGHALDLGQARRIPLRIGLQLGLDRGEQHGRLLAVRLGQHRDVLLGAAAQMQQQRGVAAVVEDHVGMAAVRPLEDAVGVVPVIGQRFAFDGEHRNAARGNGCGCVVLGREDVARSPAHFRAERLQRLDQHGGLDGHVQRAGDARAFQRLGLGEFCADGHQAGHFSFGDGDFFAAPRGQVDVGDDVVFSRHKVLHSS